MSARTPDNFPGEAIDESILVESGSYVPVINGEIAYVSGTGFRFMDQGVLKGINFFTSQSHASIRQLIHLADGGGPFEGFSSGATLTTGPEPFPTSSIWRDVGNKKIVEKTTSRNQNKTPATIQWKVYDVDGTTVLATVTDTITYSGVFEINRTRSIV